MTENTASSAAGPAPRLRAHPSEPRAGCASTRNATSTPCSRRRRPSSPPQAWTRPRRRSPTWPASESARCTGTSRGARTWSWPCFSARSTPAPTRPRRWPPRTSREQHSRSGSTGTPSSSRPNEDSPRPCTRAIRRSTPCPATSCSGSDPLSARCSTPRRRPARSVPTSAPGTCCTPSPCCACRTGRGNRVQPAHGRAPHRRAALRRRYEPVPLNRMHSISPAAVTER